MKPTPLQFTLTVCTVLLSLSSCNNDKTTSANTDLKILGLKRGDIVTCGPADKEFGSVGFETSITGKAKQNFDLAVALLHSFEYDEAEKMFAAVIDEDPQSAMAYWGVAMSNYHPLWSPPNGEELEKGSKAVAIAQSIKEKSKRESAYIDAIASFYKDHDKIDHRTRTIQFEKAMEKVYSEYPNDKEASIFYALALVASADPADKTFQKQKKAGIILNALYKDQPNHPGVVHYIIHAYDSPELAEQGLEAARKYASVAPSSAHALHMPSHIFTRLGLWDECIKSNHASVSSAQCYAKQTGIKGHWDEELHGLDYLVYAYLQKGDNKSARQQVEYLQSFSEVSPTNFKVAYAFAASPSRYYLENKMWEDAAKMKMHPANLKWNDYPWQKAIIHFARAMGGINSGKNDLAKKEIEELNALRNKLMEQKDNYKATQVEVQIKTAEAWWNFKQGRKDEALNLMKAAADLEDKTEKHPVTPGEVIPAREFLGDMLLQMNKLPEALLAYEADLKKNRNRFNGLYGAALAAEKLDDTETAARFYRQLTVIADKNSERAELKKARLYVQEKSL